MMQTLNTRTQSSFYVGFFIIYFNRDIIKNITLLTILKQIKRKDKREKRQTEKK